MVAIRKKASDRITYREAGVDVELGDAFVSQIEASAMSTAADRAGTQPGFGKGYGALFDLRAAGIEDPLLVSSTDGVGTKLRIAIETDILDTVGIDLVAMCANDVLCRGAEPLFFLDYFACDKLDPVQAGRVIAGIAHGCRLAGVALIGGETAEMPGFYSSKDFDIAGFCVGAVHRKSVLPIFDDIEPGDELIGLSSSGLHSNGFSFVRKVVAEAGLKWQDAAPFASSIPLGQALLEPTRIYVKSLLPLLKTDHGIRAIAHITGSGHAGKLHRILPSNLAGRIELDSWTVPHVFRWLRDSSGLFGEEDERNELLRTFNCGIGMVLVVKKSKVEKIIEKLGAAGEEAFSIGSVVSRSNGPVEFSGRLRFE